MKQIWSDIRYTIAIRLLSLAMDFAPKDSNLKWDICLFIVKELDKNFKRERYE